MKDLNRWTGIGNLGADPEIRYTQQGAPVANIRIACNNEWLSDGQKQTRTEWVRCVAFRGWAEAIEKYARKGMQVYVEGSLQTRKWQGQDGQDRYTTEIVIEFFKMLGHRQDGGGQQSRRPEPEPQQREPAPSIEDDDIPF